MLRLELNCIHLEPKRLKFERKGIFIPFFTYVYTIKQPTVRYYLLVCIHHILLYCKETVLLLICVHCSGFETPFLNPSSYILDFPFCHTPFLKKISYFYFTFSIPLFFLPGPHKLNLKNGKGRKSPFQKGSTPCKWWWKVLVCFWLFCRPSVSSPSSPVLKGPDLAPDRRGRPGNRTPVAQLVIFLPSMSGLNLYDKLHRL